MDNDTIEEDDSSYVPDSLKEFLQAADRKLEEDLADLLSPVTSSDRKAVVDPRQQRKIVPDPFKQDFQYDEEDDMDDNDIFLNILEREGDLELKRDLTEGWLEDPNQNQQPKQHGDNPWGESAEQEEENDAGGNSNTDHTNSNLLDILHPLADVTDSHVKRVAMEGGTGGSQSNTVGRTNPVGIGTPDHSMMAFPASKQVGRKLQNELDQEAKRSRLVMASTDGVGNDKARKSPASNLMGQFRGQNHKVAPSPPTVAPTASSSSKRNVQSRPEPTPSDERGSITPIVSPWNKAINVSSPPPSSSSTRNVQSRPEPTPSDERGSPSPVLSPSSNVRNVSSLPPSSSSTRDVQSRPEPTPSDEGRTSVRRSLGGQQHEPAPRTDEDTALSDENDNNSIPLYQNEELALTNQVSAIAVRKPIPPYDEADSNKVPISTEQHPNALNRFRGRSLVMESPRTTEHHPNALLKLSSGPPAATTNNAIIPESASNTTSGVVPSEGLLPLDQTKQQRNVVNNKVKQPELAVDEPTPRIVTRPSIAGASSDRPSVSIPKQTSQGIPTGRVVSLSQPAKSHDSLKARAPARASPPKPTEILIPANKKSGGSRRNSKVRNAAGDGRTSSASSSCSSSSTVSPLHEDHTAKVGKHQMTTTIPELRLMASSKPLFGRKIANSATTPLSSSAPSPLNPRVLMSTSTGMRNTGTVLNKAPAPEQVRSGLRSRNRIQQQQVQQQQQRVSGRRPLTRPDSNISRLLKATSASMGHVITTAVSSTSASGATSMSSSVQQQSVSQKSIFSNNRLLRPTGAGRRTADGSLSIASSIQSSTSGALQRDAIQKEEERQTRERVRARIERQKKIKEERDKEQLARVATVQEVDKRRKEMVGAAIQRTRNSRQRLERMEQERLEKLKAKINSKDERSQRGGLQTFEGLPASTDQLLQEKENHRPSLQRRSIAIARMKPLPTIPVSPNFATDLRLHSKDPSASRRTAREESPPLAASGDILMHTLRAPPPKSTMDVSTSRGKRPLTIPEAPKFATSQRYGDRPSPLASPQKKEIPDDVSWLCTLRDGNVSPISKAASSVRTGPLTIPQTPHFQHIRKRPLPKSTAEKEMEEMEYYKNHPFRSRAVKLYPPPPASLAAKGPSGKSRPLTTPEPFHFHIEERISRSHDSTKDDDEVTCTFKARPMPNFSSNRKPIVNHVTTNKKLTTPEPFQFHPSRRTATDTAKVGRSDVEGSDRKINRPTGSSGLLFRRVSAGWTPNSRRPSGMDAARLVVEETKPFKAKPMPIFVPRSIEVRSGSTSSSSEKMLTCTEKLKKAILADDVESFKARPMPQFDRVKITVQSRDPSKTRSPPMHQSNNDDSDSAQVFHARPIPKSQSKDPKIPVKQRDPMKLRSPDSVSKSEDNTSQGIGSPTFRARPVPQFVLEEPSIPVRPKENSTSRLHVRPASSDPPINERPTSFHARTIPPSVLEEPAIPVRQRDPTKLRSPESSEHHSGHDRERKEPTGRVRNDPSPQKAVSPRFTSDPPPVESAFMRRLASQRTAMKDKQVSTGQFASPKAFMASKVKDRLSRGQGQVETTSRDNHSRGQAREELEQMRKGQPTTAVSTKNAIATGTTPIARDKKTRPNLIRRDDEIPDTISLPMHRSPRTVQNKKSTMTDDFVVRSDTIQTRSSAESSAAPHAAVIPDNKDTGTELPTPMMSEEEKDEMRLQQVLAHASASFWDADSIPDGPTPKAGNARPLLQSSLLDRNDDNEKGVVAYGDDCVDGYNDNTVDLEHEAQLERDAAVACALGRATEEDETSSIMQLAHEIQRAAEEELSFHGSVSLDTREQMARDSSFYSTYRSTAGNDD